MLLALSHKNVVIVVFVYATQGMQENPFSRAKAFARSKPIPFRTKKTFALIEDNYKLAFKRKTKQLQLFNIEKDSQELTDIAKQNPDVVNRLYQNFLDFNQSAKQSQQGGDYADDDFKPVGKWLPFKAL